MNIPDTLIDYWDEGEKITDEQFIETVGTALNRVWDDGLETRIHVLGDCQTRLLVMRAECHKALCKTREQYRHPKDKDYTDFDRQTMLNAAVAEVEAEYQLVAGLEKLVSERIALIKTLLETK